MQQSGQTIEGGIVYSDVFPLVGTYGIPLELILCRFKHTDCLMDWPDYIRHALKDGHNPKTIRARILSVVGDVYGAAYKEQVEIRLNKIFFNGISAAA
jgi:alanyl-tRNA synthetase